MTLKTFSRHNRRSTFACCTCGRMTRDVDQGGTDLCPECYDLAGMDNSVNDAGRDATPDELKQAKRLLAQITAKGGDAAKVMASNDFLFCNTRENDMTIQEMNKAQLRNACKAQGIKYGNMDNAAMRRALLSVKVENKFDGLVADKTEPTTLEPKAKRSRAKREPLTKVDGRTGRDGQMSIKQFLVDQFAKGQFATDAALAYAAKTGRSRVTVTVQANKLGYGLKGDAFVPRAK